MDTALIIDNRDAPASSGATFERRDPLTGHLVTRAAAATVEDARAAVDAAAAAFPSWSRLGPGKRRAVLNAAADLLASRTKEFTDLMTMETGASAAWVAFNTNLAAGMLREAASLTTHIKGEIIPADKPGTFSMAVRRPAGVVLSIAPWNAPIILAVRSFATALACGNTVVFKTSELSPGTQNMLGQVMREAGLPAGVLNVLTNDPADSGKVVEAMIAHPAVRRVNFTGSTRVGRIIAEVAARYLKPALLELGGKASLIVLDDADLDEAVRAAAFGAFMNQGQICISTERIVVDEAVAPAFVEMLARKAATLVAGNPLNSEMPLGTIISYEAVGRIDALVKDAVSKGARILTGGRANGTLMDATVLDHVTPAMRIYSEESFGPVVAVIRVRGVEEAVRVANDTEYGLSSAVFGRDVKRALG